MRTTRTARAAVAGAALVVAALSTQGALSTASADEGGAATQDCAVELAAPAGDGTRVQVPLLGPAAPERAPVGCPAALPPPSADALQAVEELRACLAEHGVELPAPGPQPAVVALSGTGEVGDALDRAHQECAPAGGDVVVRGGAG